MLTFVIAMEAPAMELVGTVVPDGQTNCIVHYDVISVETGLERK